MEIALWVIQAILAVKLVTTALTHGFGLSKATMQEAIQKMGKPSRPLLGLAALATLLAAIGLILPGILGLPASVTAGVAAFTAAVLLVSIGLHIKAREKPKVFVSLVLLVFAAFVAWGRWTGG